MKLRAIALAVIVALLAVAIAISLRAKPLGATSIICVPVKPLDVRAERFKGVQKV